MRETRMRVAKDVDSGALAGASHAVGQVVDLLAAIRSPPGHQNVADAEVAQCRVCGIVARLHDEVRFVVAVILLENRADVLAEFRVGSLAGTKNGNSLMRSAGRRSECSDVASGAPAFEHGENALKNGEDCKRNGHRP